MSTLKRRSTLQGFQGIRQNYQNGRLIINYIKLRI